MEGPAMPSGLKRYNYECPCAFCFISSNGGEPHGKGCEVDIRVEEHLKEVSILYAFSCVQNIDYQLTPNF